MRATLDELDIKAAAAKEAARLLAKLPGTVKDRALANIADGLEAERERILAANERDIEAARLAGLSESLIDRLLLDPERLGGIARDVHAGGRAARSGGPRPSTPALCPAASRWAGGVCRWG